MEAIILDGSVRFFKSRNHSPHTPIFISIRQRLHGLLIPYNLMYRGAIDY